MAEQQKQELNVDFNVHVKMLNELQSALKLAEQEGKLANTNGNTINGLLNTIKKTILEMNQAISSGSIGKNGLKLIENNMQSIQKTIGLISQNEKDSGQTIEE